MINAPAQVPSLDLALAPDPPLRRRTVVTPPLKALQNIVRRQISGRLTAHATEAETVPWCIYVGDGQLHFANSLMGQRERLAYVLQRTVPQLVERLPQQLPQTDYEFLYQSWQAGKLTLPQLRKLIYRLTQEALVHVVAMPKTMLSFERSIGLDPILLSVPVKQTLLPLSAHVLSWQQLRPQIKSPFERPCLVAQDRFVKDFADSLDAICGPKAQGTPLEALQAQLCLYELAERLDANLLQLATGLVKLVQAEVVTIQPFRPPMKIQGPTVACIDDSATVQRKVQLSLEPLGYRVLSLTDPLRALSSLVREKPVLVFMDISMPDLDGYELCHMLKKSSALRQTPIVMLTGRDGLVDRVRARLVGVSDYITKPFDTQTLREVLEKFVPVEQQVVSR